MQIRQIKVDDDLTELFDEWLKECRANSFDLEASVVEACKDIKTLNDNRAVFVMIEEGKIIGLLGVDINKSPIGPEMIANEHFFYVIPKYRGQGLQMIRTAEKWLKDKTQCTHFILNASYLASDLAPRVIRMYGLLGYSRFEVSMIKKLGGK